MIGSSRVPGPPNVHNIAFPAPATARRIQAGVASPKSPGARRRRRTDGADRNQRTPCLSRATKVAADPRKLPTPSAVISEPASTWPWWGESVARRMMATERNPLITRPSMRRANAARAPGRAKRVTPRRGASHFARPGVGTLWERLNSVRIPRVTRAVSAYAMARPTNTAPTSAWARRRAAVAGPMTAPSPLAMLQAPWAGSRWAGVRTGSGGVACMLGLSSAEIADPTPTTTSRTGKAAPDQTTAAVTTAITAKSALTPATMSGRETLSATVLMRLALIAAGRTRSAATRPTAAGPPRSRAMIDAPRRKAPSVADQEPTANSSLRRSRWDKASRVEVHLDSDSRAATSTKNGRKGRGWQASGRPLGPNAHIGLLGRECRPHAPTAGCSRPVTSEEFRHDTTELAGSDRFRDCQFGDPRGPRERPGGPRAPSDDEPSRFASSSLVHRDAGRRLRSTNQGGRHRHRLLERPEQRVHRSARTIVQVQGPSAAASSHRWGAARSTRSRHAQSHAPRPDHSGSQTAGVGPRTRRRPDRRASRGAAVVLSPSPARRPGASRRGIGRVTERASLERR